jgi:hypothetical protein
VPPVTVSRVGRALAVSCYDGAGPRTLGVINAGFGTPVRVNVFSGVVATIVVILTQQITSGNAAKYFDAVLGVTISTMLISYLLIYLALWKLRRSHPDTRRPFKMPAYRPPPDPGVGRPAGRGRGVAGSLRSSDLDCPGSRRRQARGGEGRLGQRVRHGGLPAGPADHGQQQHLREPGGRAHLGG